MAAHLNKDNPKIFFRVGAICLQWNRAEAHLERTIENYLLDDPHVDDYLATWGNETRATILEKIIKKREKQPAFRNYALHILKYFSECRENRNFIVHGIVYEMTANSITIERYTKNPSSRQRYKVPLALLAKTERQLLTLCSHMRFLSTSNETFQRILQKRPPLPKKPALPRRIEQTLRPIPHSEKPPQ